MHVHVHVEHRRAEEDAEEDGPASGEDEVPRVLVLQPYVDGLQPCVLESAAPSYHEFMSRVHSIGGNSVHANARMRGKHRRTHGMRVHGHGHALSACQALCASAVYLDTRHQRQAAHDRYEQHEGRELLRREGLLQHACGRRRAAAWAHAHTRAAARGLRGRQGKPQGSWRAARP